MFLCLLVAATVLVAWLVSLIFLIFHYRMAVLI